MFKFGTLNDTASVIKPNNTGLDSIAQVKIDNTVARAVERHKNAMRVDGIAIKFFARNYSCGATCTCSRTTLDKMPSFVMQTNNINTIEQNGTPSIIRLRSNYEYLPSSDTIVSDDGDEPDRGSILDRLGEEYVDDDEKDIDAVLKYVEDGIFGGDKTSCPICFGTGNVNNYQFVTGERFILEASSERSYDLQYVDIDTVMNPFAFKFASNPDCSVTWTIDLPTFADGWTEPRCFLVKELQNKVKLEVYFNSTWVPFDLAWLTSTNGQNRETIKIRASGSDTSFTHIEWLRLPAQPIVVQTSHPNFASNNESFDPFITLSFEFSAEMPYFNRDSYFVDGKYGYVWKVIDLTPKATARGQLFAYDVNARIVQRRESGSYLSIYESNKFASLLKNNRGLETVQNGLYDPNLITPYDAHGFQTKFNQTDGDTF